MPKAIDVANELHKLADSIAAAGEADIERPFVFFYHHNNKDGFLALARVFPRPFVKKYEGNDLKIEAASAATHVFARIPRSLVCRVVRPATEAEYECEPLLTEDEAKPKAQK